MLQLQIAIKSGLLFLLFCTLSPPEQQVAIIIAAEEKRE